MKRVLRYGFLFWILLSVGLFVFILPIPDDILLKMVSGYVFYLFIREFFYRHFERTINAERRVSVLTERIENLPHKTSVYIHTNHLNEEEEKRRKQQDVRQFM